MKTTRLIVMACVGLLAWQNASACLPARLTSAYFGKSEYFDDALEKRILANIRKNHYVILEQRIGTSFYPFIKKGDAVYLGGKLIAGKADSFRYLGHGYYQLNRDFYFLGEKIGAVPVGESISVYVQDRSQGRPDDWPVDIMWCPVSKHANILETSGGLRVERMVYDN